MTAEESGGGAGRDETGTARESEMDGERRGERRAARGERDAEAEEDEDDKRKLGGNKDET